MDTLVAPAGATSVTRTWRHSFSYRSTELVLVATVEPPAFVKATVAVSWPATLELRSAMAVYVLPAVHGVDGDWSQSGPGAMRDRLKTWVPSVAAMSTGLTSEPVRRGSKYAPTMPS